MHDVYVMHDIHVMHDIYVMRDVYVMHDIFVMHHIYVTHGIYDMSCVTYNLVSKKAVRVFVRVCVWTVCFGFAGKVLLGFAANVFFF